MNSSQIASCALIIAGSLISLPAYSYRVEVSNSLPENRKGEIVEVPLKSLNSKATSYIVKDKDGRQVPCQITYDGFLIFPADVDSLSMAVYTVEEGKQKLDFPVYVYGRKFPERKDDLAWENDRSAYRAYGPALQKSGERAFGYDIWSKSVAYPILEQRFYDDHARHISFHVDHGNGLDDYSVGPTLGGGTAAFLDKNGHIVYPYCYRDYEILDNGPLRFTARLEYNPVDVDGEKISETRLISLDLGEWLNKTELSFDGLKSAKTLAQGIVVHSNNPTAYTVSEKEKFVAYQDLTEHADRGNGQVYVGIYSPGSSEFRFMPIDTEVRGAEGHVAAIANVRPGEKFTYYWGSGWSKGGVKDATDWNRKMSEISRHKKNPLKVSVKK